ncbi:MAG: hypothetical protein US70_C0029G0004 [Parcubacteria group bacterium GW2011_GWD2_38_11]|nr:MAG: hypothetical protein US70_C0029G0004 [Parcubacteria group bacterium GW2011_GWD2_38_11]
MILNHIEVAIRCQRKYSSILPIHTFITCLTKYSLLLNYLGINLLINFYMKNATASSPVEPIICLTHRFEAIANKYVFQPMGLSSISMKILKLLKLNESMTASELIEITGATKSNMSQRLSFLEKEKYIIRTYASDKKDKRKITIELTLAGKEMIADLEKRFKKAQISFEKKFTAKEIAQHKAFFKKLNSILDSGESELEKIFKF